MSLSTLDLLVIDCQATAAGPLGHLLEIGWARVPADGDGGVQSRLIRLPDDVPLPPAVARVTGLSPALLRAGVDASAAWDALAVDAARVSRQPAPAVVHFAQFERPFLASLCGGATVLDLVCTHEIARRLLPSLPRRGLRALAGYFGHGVGSLRRSAEHVAATVHVWRGLVPLLEAQGIGTWDDLKGWLGVPRRTTARGPRAWPMPRDRRLALPHAPGIYRMLRTGGDVLYVGKATSLHGRVNSYFRQRHASDDRMLEMLSQARDLSFAVTATALEAALAEADEIKRHRPPYNVALTDETREVWFVSPDFQQRAPRASAAHPVGPFPSALTLDQFAALARGSRASVGEGRWGPSPDVFEAGLTRLRLAHPECSRPDRAPHDQLLHLGRRLWREGRRDREREEPESPNGDGRWTPERVQAALERIALRASLAVRRARWLTRLSDAVVVWEEPGADGARQLVLDHGDVVSVATVPAGTPPQVPAGAGRTAAARHADFTVARFDRVRVLLTELKRLVADGAPVAVRVGRGAPVSGPRLARLFGWL